MSKNSIPCPFCGSTELFDGRLIPQDAYAVNCEHCDATGPIAKSKAGAVRLWNMRQVAVSPDGSISPNAERIDGDD